MAAPCVLSVRVSVIRRFGSLDLGSGSRMGAQFCRFADQRSCVQLRIVPHGRLRCLSIQGGKGAEFSHPIFVLGSG